MQQNTKSALMRFAANAMTPQDTATILASGVPMAALTNAEIQPILKKASTGAMLSEQELGTLIRAGVNTELLLGIKPRVEAVAAPIIIPPAAPVTQNVTTISSDPIERLDKKSRSSIHAKARTRAIYALRDALRNRGAQITDELHTEASGFARTETGLTASILATLSKNGRQVNREVGTDDALTAYRSALADAGIVVSDDLYAVAKQEALASREAFLAASRRVVVRALALS